MGQHGRFLELDALRGVAAVCVVIFHAWPFFGSVLPGGYLAVDLFFMLSGFVIEHAYSAKLSGPLTAGSFMKHRLIRLYPLFALGMGLGLSLMLILKLVGSASASSDTELLALFIMGASLVPSWFSADAFPLNVPAWSLFYEIVVNALYAVFFSALLTRRLAWTVALALCVFAIGAVTTGSADLGPKFSDAPFALARAIFGFGLGVLIYRYRIRLRGSFSLVCISCVAAMAIPVVGVGRVALDLACILILFPYAVASLSQQGQAQVPRLLVSLGDWSYALYVIHWPLLWLFRGVAERLGAPPALSGCVYLVLVLAGAAVAERYFDRPVRTFFSNRNREASSAA